MLTGTLSKRARRGKLALSRAARLAVAVGAVQMLPGAAARGASGMWTQTTSGGLWSATGNWSGGTVANGSGFTADFSTLNITADNTVHLDSARTIGALIFADSSPSNNWTLDNNSNAANTLTLAVSSGTPTVTVNNQSATISGVIAGTQGMNKSGTGTLTLAGGSSANTLTGTTTVNAGTLVLNKTANTVAIAGRVDHRRRQRRRERRCRPATCEQ